MAAPETPSTPSRLARRGPLRRLVWALTSIDSFGSVLVAILVTYLLSVSLTGVWARSVILLLQMVTVWLALRVSKSHPRVRVVSTVIVVLALVVAVVNLFGKDSEALSAIVFLTGSLLYFVAPISILRKIATSQSVDLEVLLGAIDAYLLIGMFFAFAYMGLGFIQSGPFFQGGIEGNVSDALFFSFTTLTTTGYGNLVPAGNPGQSLAVLEMLIGQFFLVTAVAKVINAWRPARWQATQGDDTEDA